MQIGDMLLSSENINTDEYNDWSREQLIFEGWEYREEATQVRDYYIFTQFFDKLYLLEVYYGYWGKELKINFKVYKGKNNNADQLEFVGWSIYGDEVLPEDLPEGLLSKIRILENEFEKQKEVIKDD